MLGTASQCAMHDKKARRIIPAMSEQSGPTLRAALAALASRDEDHASNRNEIGFNGADSAFGHALAEKPEKWWTPRMQAAAYRMLAKYRRQLLEMGIDFDKLPKPGEAGQAAATNVHSKYAPARAPGLCAICGKRFEEGASIGFRKGSDGRYSRFHEACDREPSEPTRHSAPHVSSEPGATSAPIMASGPGGNSAPYTVSVPISRSAPNETSEPSTARATYTQSEPCTASAPLKPSAPIVPVTITGRRVVDVLGPQGSIALAMGDAYEHRPQQLTLSEKIEQALARARKSDPVEGQPVVHAHVIAEAGTGTGKSFAYIVAAALRGRKVIVSTKVKALQDQLLLKDLPFAAEHIMGGLTYAALKGRSNYVCKLAHQQSNTELDAGNALFVTPEAPQQWAALNEWIASGRADEVNGDLERAPTMVNGDVREMLTVDSDGCLGKKCPLFGQCYVEQQKAKARDADIVVVNHALLLIDAKVKDNSEGHVSILPESFGLIIDEAHSLEEVATDALGEELSQARWARLERAVERFTRKHKEADPDQAQEWMQLASEVGVPWMAMFEGFKDRMIERDPNATTLLLHDERPAAEPVLKALQALYIRMDRAGAPTWLNEQEAERWGKLKAQMEKLAEWVSIATTPPPDDEVEQFVRYVQREGFGDRSRYIVNVKPIDVSGPLRDMIWSQYPSVTALSATLAVAGNFSHFRRRTGCTPQYFPDVQEYVCPSPFDYEKNAVLFVPQASDLPSPRTNSPQEQEAYFDKLAALEYDLLQSGTNRVFLLFTSNRALRAVRERLSDRLINEWEIFVQGEQQRFQIVEAFKETGGKKVLFATRTFFEGIDLQGEALTMVVLDKLAFASHEDPIIAAKSKQIESRGGNAFSELLLPDVITTMKQAVGRLIRSSKDYGTVAILDVRLRTASYGVKIVKSLPPMRPAMGGLAAVREVYASR